MITNVIRYFFPDLKSEEFRKFSLLGIIAFFIIGTYWLLRLLKQAIFYKVAFPEILGWPAHQGGLFQPTAKFLSPWIVLIVVLIYSKLIDIVKKHQLFYIICSFFAVIFSFCAGVIFVNEYYGPQVVGKHLLASAGWLSYFSIECFGSLLPALFWSFTNSISDSESAKSGFPLIVVLMQIGAIGGSAMLLFSKQIGALSPLIFIATLFIFAIIAMVYYFMKTMPSSLLIGNKTAAQTEKKKDGFFEGFYSGLVLLFTRPYLLGILVISTFYEIAMQIVEYQMQRQASICPDFSSSTGFCWFQGLFGIGVNTLSLIIALLGTSYLIKKLGIRISLLIYPIVFFLSLTGLFIFFKTGPTPIHLLWALFMVMMIIKGMSYAVNNPIKEIMYIPTSKDAKFKSKGWVDMFGGRFSKATGGRITNLYRHNLNDLMIYGTFISFGLIAAWILAALYVGKKNQQLIKDGEIIE